MREHSVAVRRLGGAIGWEDHRPGGRTCLPRIGARRGSPEPTMTPERAWTWCDVGSLVARRARLAARPPFLYPVLSASPPPTSFPHLLSHLCCGDRLSDSTRVTSVPGEQYVMLPAFCCRETVFGAIMVWLTCSRLDPGLWRRRKLNMKISPFIMRKHISAIFRTLFHAVFSSRRNKLLTAQRSHSHSHNECMRSAGCTQGDMDP